MNDNKEKNLFRMISEKRIRLPKLIRLSAIGVIAIILIFSLVNANAAYNKPETTKMTYESLSYIHNGNFNYRVYLKNNTVYDGKDYLNPGEGKYFKKLIDYISFSFTYKFDITKKAQIYGSYYISAEIQTAHWKKQYHLTPSQLINSSGTTFNIFEEFKIDYRFYEEVVNRINQETGITITSPKVEIKFNLNLNMNVEGKNTVQYYTQTLNLALASSTIDISDSLSNSKRGAETKTQETFHQEVITEKNKWTTAIYLMIGIIFLSIILTRSDLKKSSNGKTIKKIMKKYGEWIVEVEKPIKNITESEIINCKSMDGLMKISEELGKPVIHTKPDSNTHIFYVLENLTRYQFVITDVEETSKTVICPDCTTLIQVKGIPGKSISVVCPKCIKKGVAKI